MSSQYRLHDIQMVLGICLSFPKMGSSLNSFLSPRIADSFASEKNYENVAIPIFVGSVIMSISLVLAIGNSILSQSWHGSIGKTRKKRDYITKQIF